MCENPRQLQVSGGSWQSIRVRLIIQILGATIICYTTVAHYRCYYYITVNAGARRRKERGKTFSNAGSSGKPSLVHKIDRCPRQVNISEAEPETTPHGHDDPR